MEAQYVNQVAQTIYQQIKQTATTMIIFSWGANNFIATVHNNMASLRFRVNGLQYKGYVVISYNEGTDLYEIYKMKVRSKETTLAYKDVFAEDLGSILDRMIETGGQSYEQCKNEIIEHYSVDEPNIASLT